MSESHRGDMIAKNTFALYLRTLVMLIVGLFTSRLILQALGVEDYGVYNVVGGTISMFSIFSSSISSAISRFITFELGKGDLDKLKSIFNASLSIQLAIGIILVLVSELIGLWMLKNGLNIPTEKLYAAHWVLQFCIFGFFVSIISAPFNACIIAHEKMKVFAYMGLLEVFMKLLFVWSLFLLSDGRLILYAFFLFLAPCILQLAYALYCRKNFLECRYKFEVNRKQVKEIGEFAWWGFFGNAAYMLNTQGVNILINIFFNVALNAARGVVGQVENAVMQFVNNFMTAISPQITKSYASGDISYMSSLVCRGAKFSIFLLLIFLIPIEFEADYILGIWLSEVPPNAAIFLRWSLACTAVVLLGNTSLTAVMATGKIKNYQLVVTLVGCLVFPLTWLGYKLGFPAFICYPIYLGIYLTLVFVRLLFLKKLMGFKPKMFVTEVIRPIIMVCIICAVPIWIIHKCLQSGFIPFLIVLVFSIIITVTTVFYVGLTRPERQYVVEKIASLGLKIKGQNIIQ